MGSLGVQEMGVIFLVALVLFGPKKLPELGRTIGKALTEFRRASNDLKSTFEREMQTLERETAEIQDHTRQIATDIRSSTSLDFSSFDTIAEAEPSSPSQPLLEEHTQTAHDPSTVGASEVPGAESNGTTAHPAAAIEGTVPRDPSTHGTPEPHAPADGHQAEVSQHS